MKDSLLQLDDLPDEILMHIFKKLSKIQALYYLTGINQRLNRIVHDSVFTNSLHILLYGSVNSCTCTSSLPDAILDRFCSEILPQIGHQVKTLVVETTSMNRILHATNYPNLCQLGIYDVEVEVAKSLFIDEHSLGHIQKNRISSFFIKFNNKDIPNPENDTYPSILTQILTIFYNLRCLKFNPATFSVLNLYFNMPATVISSTLSELHISVHGWKDCLYLLDGRFDQLRAFYVSLFDISSDTSTQHERKLLPNLRIFSLQCDLETSDYDVSILPLLHRMVNLEKLHLDIIVRRYEELVDSNALKKDIISHMPRLSKFTFYIYSIICYYNQTDFSSNEYIQKTPEFLFGNQIISYVDHFQEARFSQCHIYSHPCKLKIYNNVTNNFPGGLCKNAANVSLYDERPFEYEFFMRIAQSFPFMKQLIIKNSKAQNDKEMIRSNKNNQSLPVIKYPNLILLDLRESHDDYVELFLFHATLSCPNKCRFTVSHQSLERVTYGFTRTITGSNCEKFGSIFLYPKVEVDQRIKDYLPHTYIYTSCS